MLYLSNLSIGTQLQLRLCLFNYVIRLVMLPEDVCQDTGLTTYFHSHTQLIDCYVRLRILADLGMV
jgi:hypothetical protein